MIETNKEIDINNVQQEKKGFEFYFYALLPHLSPRLKSAREQKTARWTKMFSPDFISILLCPFIFFSSWLQRKYNTGQKIVTLT